MVAELPDFDPYDPNDPNYNQNSNPLIISTLIPRIDIPDNSTLKYELIPYTGPSLGPGQYYRVKALKSFGVVGVNYVKKITKRKHGDIKSWLARESFSF